MILLSSSFTHPRVVVPNLMAFFLLCSSKEDIFNSVVYFVHTMTVDKQSFSCILTGEGNDAFEEGLSC